ncbi:MAG: DUF1028 domain-containing protein, partial [Longimicrobiales bacterium]
MRLRQGLLVSCGITLVAVAGWSQLNVETQVDTAVSPLDEVERWPPVATFSVLGYDAETGEVGGAVQSRVFSVGNGVLWAEA